MNPTILLTGGCIQKEDGTPAFALNQTYADAIFRAGGTPLLALGSSMAEKYVHCSDGLFLTGGVDVSPALYNEETLPCCGEQDHARDEMELALIRAFLAHRKPIFGVCRGLQMLNVAFGGSLWQDIPSQLGGTHSGGVYHLLQIEPDTALSALFGSKTTVNSYHHQAIHRLGEHLQATAYSQTEHGPIVEAFQHEALAVSAVQWHPERMTGPERSASCANDMFPLFRSFVDACSTVK